MSNIKRIDFFLNTIVKLHWELDFSSFWPMNPSQLQASYSDLLALEFYVRFKKNKNVFKKAMDQIKPNAIRSLLYQAGILGLKVANYRKTINITKEKLIEYMVFLLDITAEKIKGDEFGRDDSYRILTDSEIKALVERINWKSVLETEGSLSIAQLGVSLESLVWSLQFDAFRTAGTLIHGPYFIDKGTLIIKDFIKLKSLVWNNKMFADKISLYLLYKPGFILKLNYANQQKEYSDSPVNCLIKSAIKIDGQNSSFDKSWENTIEKSREQQTKNVNSLSPLEIIKKGAEIYYFMYKEFFDFYGVDWKPPKTIYKRIDQNGLKYFKLFKDEGKINAEYYHKLFDPRNSFIG